MLLGGAFDSEWIKLAAIIFDARFAAPKKPQTPAFVEIPRVAGAMPDARADAKLRFLVADPIEIAAQHVIAVDHNLAGLIGGLAVFEKRALGVIGDWPAPLLAEDFQIDLRDWFSGQ